jgi:hypothetical protein
MKWLFLFSLLVSTSSFAYNQGHCVGESSNYDTYCSAFPVKEACAPRRGVCRWVESQIRLPSLKQAGQSKIRE